MDCEELAFEEQFGDELDNLRDLEDFEPELSVCLTNSHASQGKSTENRPNHVRNLFSDEEIPDVQQNKRSFEIDVDKVELGAEEARASKRVRRDDLQLDEDLLGIRERKAKLAKNPFEYGIGNTISITTSEGHKLYAKLNRNVDNENVFSHSRQSLQLLSVPFEDLRFKAEQIRENMQRFTKHSPEIPVREVEDTTTNCLLWVEKFKPHTYLDLLSDDGTNRILLRWLKLWDKVVFGREIAVKAKVDKPTKPFRQKFVNKKLPGINEELDVRNCPKQKLSLLCGPPGLGKTTLAHIIARHAGYNVVEMNASDDRSPEAFRTQIEAATQMRAVFGETPRPNCLIIDEIDGAPAAAINVLVSFATSDGGGTKKKGGNKRLNRPVICICNDQYVPALRQLRQMALILNFPPTIPSRLASRLLEISNHERLKADMSSLLVLCEKANNDIRSCLSTLQFIYKKGRVLRVMDIQNLSIGLKDVQRSLFYVWQEIFQITNAFRNKPAVKDATDSSQRYYNVLSTVQNFGDYDRIMKGVFENYLQIKSKTLRLNNVIESGDWLFFHDVLNTEIQQNQTFQLMAYLPFCPVKFHCLYASHNYVKITYPTTEYEMPTKLVRSQNLISTMKSEMTPNSQAFALPEPLILDILPFLTELLQPTLRPVNTQLYSVKEKEELEHLIKIMIAYNVTYQQELAEDGTYIYTLEPKFDQVTCYGLEKNRQLTYAAKQLIAREVELERVRRGETLKSSANQTKKAEAIFEKSEEAKPVTVEKKALSRVEKAVDFFGRPIQKPIETTSLKANVNSGQSNIWYHFKEGFSNAVRRNVRIQDLL